MCPKCGSNHRKPLVGSNDTHWYKCRTCGYEYHKVMTLTESLAIPNK